MGDWKEKEGCERIEGVLWETGRRKVVKLLKECCERLEEGSCERIEGVLWETGRRKVVKELKECCERLEGEGGLFGQHGKEKNGFKRIEGEGGLGENGWKKKVLLS